MANISNHQPLDEEEEHTPYIFTFNPFSVLQSESESEPESDCLYGHDEEYDQMDYITDLFHSRGDTEHVSNNNNNNNIEELGLGLRVASIQSDSDTDTDTDTEELTEVAEQNWSCPSFDTDGSGSVIDRIEEISVSSDREVLEWEILLAVNNLERDLEFVMDGREGFLYTPEFDTLISQFVETVRGLRGSPPAAKSVVDSLPLVALKMGDAKQDDDEMCAVCKDGILIGEKVIQLPCGHYYHGDCIVPWLSMRNTCPVCRFELPTDDVDYERSKNRENDDEMPVGYGLDLSS